ncbi:MAG TPA: GspH/FimT family pseudopilin [Steroidobacteraceae bacterium]|jgi:type IV fimbrial biogenesis protein FimT
MEIAPTVGPERSCAGFTLLELVMVVSIAAILLALGVPSFRYVTTANRLAAEVNGLIGDMQFARTEAIKEGQSVVACVSTDGATCTGGNTWQSGWIVCASPQNDGACDGTPPYRVQKSFASLNSTDTFVADGNTSVLNFNREGFATGLAGPVTVKLHNATSVATYTRCLQVSAVGILQVETVGVGNCT